MYLDSNSNLLEPSAWRKQRAVGRPAKPTPDQVQGASFTFGCPMTSIDLSAST